MYTYSTSFMGKNKLAVYIYEDGKYLECSVRDGEQQIKNYLETFGLVLKEKYEDISWYYLVTGVFYNTRQHFAPIICGRNEIYAFGINLWKGSVWKVVNGKRKLLKRVS